MIPTFRHPVVLRGNKWALLFSLQLQKLLQIKIFILVVASLTPPMLSQHSRSQALVKEEGCDRRGELTLNLAILMEMKPERKPLGHNPLSDAPYRNPGMVLNGQGPGRHPLGDAPCRDLGMMSSEQGSSHRILSVALHRRPGIVKNEQGSSHLS